MGPSLIQWNQSYSYMPWERRVQAAGIEKATNGVEPMDMEEEVVDEEVAEEEEMITLGTAHYRAIQQDLADIWFELADQRREAREDKHLADKRFEALQVMLRAILARLPPASGASSSAP